MEKKFVITIARGFGSGGKEIAGLVANKLGINCHEHSILTLASGLSGLDRSHFANADEKLIKPNLLNSIKETFSTDSEGRFVSNDLAWEMVKIFLSTDFEGGRHIKRVEKINKIL